jgi:hypothetical protein
MRSDNVKSEHESSECVLIDWSLWKFWFAEVMDEIFVWIEMRESLEYDEDHEWHSLRST